MFFSICLSKEINLIAEAIKSLGILTKKCVSKNKKVFLFKKEMFRFIKKDVFVFHTIFKLDFIR